MKSPAEIRPGHLMERETFEAPFVFARTVLSTNGVADIQKAARDPGAIYTIARGSSDAAANILSYEFMRFLRIPVTSLPPSVFSLGPGVALDRTAVMVISQSGASDDLVTSAKGAAACGATVFALTNSADSPVEQQADVTIPIGAGPELAVPATKSVIGSIAAGMALLAALHPEYVPECQRAAQAFRDLPKGARHPLAADLAHVLCAAENVYVIGRGAGFGAAHEVALKLKETCALHAEAFSASEVLHGPLQLATNPLAVLILDTGEFATQASLDTAQKRFSSAGAEVVRICTQDMTIAKLTPAAAAAMLLFACYPVILDVALSQGYDPDAPDKLAKVTRTL